MGFTSEQLAEFRGATVPDLIGADCRLLFVGINPGLWTAATQTHFCHPSNRFYPALRKAGLIDFEIDTATGMTDHQRAAFVGLRLGVTNLVAHATARASELTRDQLVAGAVDLENFTSRHRPRVVAIAGVTAYRKAFAEPRAGLGLQTNAIGGSRLWVIPNPSGLNAHETVDSLANWFGKVASDAGLR